MPRWLTQYLHRRRAAKEWRIVERWHRRLVWADEGNSCGGYTVIVGEINGLGVRRIRVVSKPEYPATYKTSIAWGDANRWLTEPQPVTIPKLRLIK